MHRNYKLVRLLKDEVFSDALELVKCIIFYFRMKFVSGNFSLMTE